MQVTTTQMLGAELGGTGGTLVGRLSLRGMAWHAP
jgi:hypothetical protein